MVWYLGSASGVVFGECEWCGIWGVRVSASMWGRVSCGPRHPLPAPDASPIARCLPNHTHSSGVSCCSLSTTPLSVNISWWRPTLCLPRSPPLLPATCLLLQGWFMNGMHVGTPLSGKQNKGAALSWQALPLCPLTLLPGIVQCVLATPHGLFKTT